MLFSIGFFLVTYFSILLDKLLSKLEIFMFKYFLSQKKKRENLAYPKRKREKIVFGRFRVWELSNCLVTLVKEYVVWNQTIVVINDLN